MSILTNLQDAVVSRLESLRDDLRLADLPVIPEHKGSIDSQILQRIQQASLGLVVSTPEFERGEGNPNQILVSVAVVITENVTQNQGARGAKISSTELAELVYALLQQWQPAEQSWAPFQFQNHALREVSPEAQILFHVTTFRTRTITRIITT